MIAALLDDGIGDRFVAMIFGPLRKLNRFQVLITGL
jgi:hypothetical protein